MGFVFTPMDEAAAQTIVGWRYPAPYDIYNMDFEELDEVVEFFVDPENSYYSISDATGELVAFCCFGHDAQVPGADYSADALDIGLGVRPDLTGQGRGAVFSAAVVDFAQRAFAPTSLRVTIAAFNLRARRAWEKVGFQLTQTFDKEMSNEPFWVLVRDA
jgi:RimJ/RimL family protein N-acetyltransferase